jgi:hypothetical protein
VQSNDRKEKTSWNILYRDIMKIAVIIFDKEKQINLSEEELLNLVDNEQEDNIYFIMKILYHQLGDTSSFDSETQYESESKKRMLTS